MRNSRSPNGARVEGVDLFLSLGSNLGDRRQALEDGVAALTRAGLRAVARSSIYETEPVDVEDQPWFLNMVVQSRTALPLDEVLRLCKRIESDLGRVSGRRYGPRRLDIDILLYGDETREDPGLVIPHPRMSQRRFVLVPLVEIAPHLRDPRTGRPFCEVLNGLDEGKKVLKSASTES